MLKVINRNTRTSCEICSKLTIKKPLSLLYCFTACFSVSIVNFEHVIDDWEISILTHFMPSKKVKSQVVFRGCRNEKLAC